MLGLVTAVKLRQWRGVKAVAGPSGVVISTRLRTTAEDEYVLDLVAEQLGKLRRADLGVITRPRPVDRSLDGAAKRQVRRDRSAGCRGCGPNLAALTLTGTTSVCMW